MLAKDPNQIRQAVADFDMFLAGKRAPALIGQSLATVVRHIEIPQIASMVLNWARSNRELSFLEAVMAARSKVFDIFFYRVVKYQNIHRFFPAFEEALVSLCPTQERGHLNAMFLQYKWQDIRPIGTFRDQRFVIEKRQEIKVETEKFNENIYKNATFSVLSADKKYTFDNAQVGEQIASYQAKVQEIFSDFVDLVQDKNQKKEIMLANEGDKYNQYQKKEAFRIEDYITQLLDLSIALFNDDFLYQSIQIFNLIHQLIVEHKLQLEKLRKFQEKAELFNTQKLEEYANNRTGALLIKQIVSLFTHWQPQRMLTQLQLEESRRVRRLLLKLMECYGKNTYRLLVEELSKAHSLPWWYTRNLAYLLGRITSDNETYKNQAVEFLYQYWQPNAQRQLVTQIITTLGAIGTDLACDRLLERLKIAEAQFDDDSQAADTYSKIILALIATESDRAIERVIESTQKQEQMDQYIEKFPRFYMPDRLLLYIAGKIRKEIQRLKFSFSLLGDKATALLLLKLIAHMGNDMVKNLCRDIIKALPKKHALVVEAERILAEATPLPLYAKDHTIQKLATVKNQTEMICHILETSATGRLVIRALDKAECEIEFEKGEAKRSIVRAYYLEGDNAFYWCFLLDYNDIESIYFTTNLPSRNEPNIRKSTEVLICEGLVQRGQVLQIAGNYLSPESRFHQKRVHRYYTNFIKTEDPEKYTLVWQALAKDTDLATLQQVTHLSKSDIYRILFYFLKHDMLIVDGSDLKEITANIDDGLAMLALNLRRIENRPVMFTYYKTLAETCADLMRAIQDDVIQFALGVLRNYCLEYYQYRKVFTNTNIEICQQVLEWVAGYAQNHNNETRQSLLDYISFTFRIEDASLKHLPVPAPEKEDILERLENIEIGNDPMDEISNDDDSDVFDDVFGSLNAVLGSALGVEQVVDDTVAQGSGLTAAEEEMIRDLFDNIALAYVKPLKDFIRELYRNWEAERATSFEWFELIEPIFSLLSGASAKMGYQQIADVVKDLENVIIKGKKTGEEQGLPGFDQPTSEKIITTYQKLCAIQPKTFSIVMSEEDLEDKKDVLIVKFILKQISGVTDKELNKILFAGLNSFDKFMQSNADEIAALTGMSKTLANEIYFKFYQYRNVYYQNDDPDYQEKFIAMFEMNLKLLKEMQEELDLISMSEGTNPEKQKDRKEALLKDRQRMLWSIFILLCIKQEYEMVETIQQSVFDVRIQLLNDYLEKLMSVDTYA